MFGRFKAVSKSGQPETLSRVSKSSSRKGRFPSKTPVNTEARLHHRWVFLTYSQCSLELKDEFEEGFSYMLQRNKLPKATYYGCREHHETEGIHYNVLVNLQTQPNWSLKHARSMFAVEHNECESLDISTPKAKQKEGDCFGQRPTSSVERQQEWKRKWEEIESQLTAPAKLAKLKEEFSDVFYKCSMIE